MIYWVLLSIEAYIGVGILFAVYFAMLGVVKLDKAARGAPIAFRLLILPGAIALWPYLLTRLLHREEAPRAERNAHRDATRKASA